MNIEQTLVLGIGLETSLGMNCTDNWQRISAGESNVRPISRFALGELKTRIAGTVDRDLNTCRSLTDAVARNVTDQAISNSGLQKDALQDAEVFLTLPIFENSWSTVHELAQHGSYEQFPTDMFAEECYTNFANDLAESFGFRHCPYIVNTACGSGGTILQLANYAIKSGACDVAVVVGADCSVYEESLVRLSLLSAMSTSNDNPQGASRPFTLTRDGFVPGEGGGAIILASEKFAREHGATPIARLSGAGDATDNFHRTRSSPDGSTIIKSMLSALHSAQLTPGQITYVNAHGTSTPENDKMEGMGIAEIFGTTNPNILVTANKSMVGHCLVAAGMVEAVLSILSITEQSIPPTINQDNPDTEIDVNVVTQATHTTPVKHVLSNSFGFGGQNVSIIFSEA